jgi:branched-chain amino acid transport system substrate-binding protein
LVTPLAIAAAMVPAANAQDTVKVGMVMPLTGTLADAGKQVVAGARLYMSQHGVTVAGKHIDLIVKDEGSSFDTGKRLIQEAIVNDKVDILAGGLTGDLMAAAPVIAAARKPTVIMLSSTSAVVDKSPTRSRPHAGAIGHDPGGLGHQERDQEGRHPLIARLEAEATFKARYMAAGGEIAENIRAAAQSGRPVPPAGA